MGGSIRDLIRGEALTKKTDLDICTSAYPRQTKTLLRGVADSLWAVGERFGTIGCIMNGRTYEVTTFRKEVYSRSTRKPQVEFGKNVLEDLVRRDFTINAIALKLPEGELIDPHNGAQDIADKRLRTPLSPRILFDEDPLRMQRAARFEAQLGVTLDPEIVEVMKEMTDRLDIVSKERQIAEFRRLICLPNPTSGLKRLSETGLLAKVLPGVDIRDFANVKELAPDFQLRLAGLLLSAEQNTPHQLPLLSQLKLSKADVLAVRNLIDLVNLIMQLPEPENEASLEGVRYISVEAKTEQCWNQVLELGRLIDPEVVSQLVSQFEKLRAEGEDPFVVELPLSGDEIMRIFDLPAGPQIGEAQRLLKGLYLRRGRMTKRQAVSELKKIYKNN